MPIWLSYPQWKDGRSKLAVNPFNAIHKAHVLDIASVQALEKLGLPLDLARLVTGFYPKYADRVALAFAKALFMGGQKMNSRERKVCSQVFDHPNKAYHYLNVNSEWVTACCSDLAMWNLNSPPIPEWISMHLPGFVLPVQDHIMLGIFNAFEDPRPMVTTPFTELPGFTLGPGRSFVEFSDAFPVGSLTGQILP